MGVIPFLNASVPRDIRRRFIRWIIRCAAMGTGYQQRTVQHPVGGILDTASLELRELQARLLPLTRRIQTLKRALAALQDLQSASALHQQQTSSGCPDQNSLSPDYHEVTFQDDPALRRACRIALLEASEGLSEDEILIRITRRESYTFSDHYSGRTAIANELNAMFVACEAERVKCPSGTKWRRVEPASEISTDPISE